MYRILLADDEPIILSGIKYLIDWGKRSSNIIDTACSGNEALDIIKAKRPDIVICDINMPGMSGIELLRKVNDDFPGIVFIMLTNYHDFELVRDALRCKAVDYLLKNQLIAETLEKSLDKAIGEFECRRRLNTAALFDNLDGQKKEELIENGLQKILDSGFEKTGTELIKILEDQGFLNSFAAIYMALDYTALPNYGILNNDEIRNLFSWQKDITGKISKSFFRDSIILKNDDVKDSIILYCWNLGNCNWQESIRMYREKLSKATMQITRLGIHVFASLSYPDSSGLDAFRNEVMTAKEVYYNAGFSVPGDGRTLKYRNLGLTGISFRLSEAISSGNTHECECILEKIISRVREMDHEKIQALWLCGELYDTVSALLPENMRGVFFSDRNEMYGQIELLNTRAQVVKWLETMKMNLMSVVFNVNSSQEDIMGKVKVYIERNTDKHIMLQELADYVSISPGYLSTLFKKQFSQNLTDYINQTKVNKACALIRQGKYRIYEISYMLGFENAYYFTRVFKRHTGISPTEYQKNINKRNP